VANDDWFREVFRSSLLPPDIESKWKTDAVTKFAEDARNQGDKLAGLRNLITCLHWKMEVPPEVLDVVTDAIREWEDGGGNVTLDKAFAVPKRGSHPLRTETADRKLRGAVAMAHLIAVFKLSIEEAATVVSFISEGGTYQASTLKTHWEQEGFGKRMKEGMMPPKGTEFMSDEEKTRILRLFPRHAFTGFEHKVRRWLTED
jgi:hypothetical protein